MIVVLNIKLVYESKRNERNGSHVVAPLTFVVLYTEKKKK